MASDDAGPVPTTVTEALSQLRDLGYVVDMTAAPDGMVRCGSCATLHPARDAVVDQVHRFEGATDPDDEAIVVAITCTRCGLRGTLVSAYGPAADADDAAVLRQLTSR